MDGATRARIVLGSVAVLLAALASLALLNVLFEEPLPTGQGDGDGGGSVGGPISLQPPDDQPAQNGSDEDGGGQGQRRTNPCDAAEPLVRGIALVTTVIAMGLWVLAVWWRQARQTRVMNLLAIFALLMTLVAITALFAWWIVHKICSLDVFDLKSCMEIASSLRNAFFAFLVLAAGFIGYAFVRARKGGRFWGLWSIAGAMFVYLMLLALVGWLVAEDLCERTFPDPDDRRLPNEGGDNGGGDDGPDPGTNTGSGSPPSNSNDRGGGSPSLGGGNRGPGGGGGGAPGPAMPQVSPFALLAILAIAAIVTVLVLAVKGRQDQQRAMAMAAMERHKGGMMRLFSDTDVESNDAVVAAYRRFLDHCLLAGVPRKHNETPREHGRRSAPRIGVAYDDMLPLLDAYTHIRLAQGPLPDDRRQQALGLARLWRPRTVKARRVRKPGGAP